jgi:hypothetical protein
MRLQDLAEMDVKFLVHEVGRQTLQNPAARKFLQRSTARASRDCHVRAA